MNTGALKHDRASSARVRACTQSQMETATVRDADSHGRSNTCYVLACGPERFGALPLRGAA